MLWCAVAACGGRSVPPPPPPVEPPVARAEPAAGQAAEPPPGHGAEMIPGMADGAGPGPGSAREAMATDREGLLRAGRRALVELRPSDALSIAEVLLLVHGDDDPEARELRGRSLRALGDLEAAAEEFAACCEAGRQPCCAALDGL